LDRYISREELYATLNSMQNVNSLGMDCFPFESNKAVWDPNGDNLCCLASKVFALGHFLEFLNQDMVIIIPKNIAKYSIRGS
jgi:hypothetical protein